MFNWYEVKVEQQIAQERYEVIKQGHRLARSRPLKGRREGKQVRVRNWLGNQLINWGCIVKTSCQMV